jgi:hypothetical protein
MATISWVGAAPKISQVRTFTFATAGTSGDIYTVTVGSKVVTYTTTSGTIATFLPLLNAYLAGLGANYPEFAEITFTNPTASTIVCTAVTPGNPFKITFSTNSAGTTINGSTSSTGTATVANSSPYDISCTANYSGAALPATGDTLYIDLEGAILTDSLDSQSAVVLAVRRITAQDVTIGRPKTNPNGYTEYRADFWQCTATLDYLNTQSQRIKLDYLTGQTALTIDSTGTGIEQNIPAVLLKGTHASNAWVVNQGQVGFAFFDGDGSARLHTLSLEKGATITCGIGCTNDTLTNNGGVLYVYSAIATNLFHPTATKAITTIYGTGAVAGITSQGGTVDYRTTGALAANSVWSGTAKLTFDNDQRTKTVSGAIKVYSQGVVVLDSNRVVSGGLTIAYTNCVGRPVLPPNSQIIVSYL